MNIPIVAQTGERSKSEPYTSSSIKRSRRSKADMDQIRSAIRSVLSTETPMTDRQVFYQLVSQNAIDKTKGEYNQVVVRLLTEMRRAGDIPFDWIADNTRLMRKPRTYSSLEAMLTQTKEFYRRAPLLSKITAADLRRLTGA